LVVPAAPGIAATLVGPGGGVGVRISSHPVPVALARALGRPITATSANPGGSPAACDVASARAYFGDRVMYLDGGPTPGHSASTVIAISELGDMTLLRPGPIAIPDDL
jgi:L-threonylcarbamoyladenylate synthase